MMEAGWLLAAMGLFAGMGALGSPAVMDADLYEKQCREYYHLQVPGKGYAEHFLDFADVRKFIQEMDVTSARELVTSMENHQQFDPFLGSFVLMHRSQSAQKASVTSNQPRVVFYGNGLILGVTDHPTKSNDRVEVIHYDAKVHAFRFGLIDFSKKDPFNPEPQNCKECHGAKGTKPPLPIWATYRTWPGAHSDRMEFMSAFDDEKNPAQGIYAKLRPEHPREDAAAFNGYLNSLNFERIAHELRESKDFARYRYAFLGAMFHCEDLPGFLGPEGSKARKAHEDLWGTRTYESLLEETDREMRDGFARRLALAKTLRDERAMRELQFADEDDIVPIAGLRYLFEQRGVDVKRFSYNFQPRESHGYGFSQVGAGTGGLRMSFCHFLPEAVRADRDLLPLLEVARRGHSSESSEQQFCGTLRKKSILAFTRRN